MKLRQLFESFISTQPGFERIDDLLRNSHEIRKRADYLLWNRKIIVEQKVLVVDQGHWPQQFIDRLMQERRSILFGQLSSDAIFSRFADGEALKRDMFLAMTKGFEDDVADADKQTRDTRNIFQIPDAVGVVVLLNESASALPPELIGFGLHHVLNKKRDDQALRYVQNDAVVVISSAHVLPDSHGNPGMPCFATATPQCRARGLVDAFTEELFRRWALFNNLPARAVTQAELSRARARQFPLSR